MHSAAADAPIADAVEQRRHEVQRRTLSVLIVAQIVGGLGVGSALSVGGLLALDLSGSDFLAGGATTAITLGSALLALPLVALAIRSGRRVSLGLGWLLAVIGGGTVIGAAVLGSYLLLLLGLLLFGASTTANLQSRYAAADLALPDRRARDLSYVVWSTTVGTVLGPNLTEPGAAVGRALGIPELAGPFVFSMVGVLIAAIICFTLLRPDPLRLSREMAAAIPVEPGAAEPPTGTGTVGDAWQAVKASPGARLGMSTVVLGHGVMVSVMTMTPVHLTHHGAQLSVIGLTISLHIAGMFAMSPVFGVLGDRWGRVPTICLGLALLAASVVVAGTAGDNDLQIIVGLVLLGLGWSAGLVVGSTLLGESVPQQLRPRVQGLSDLVMGLVGATGGALSGVLLGLIGFGGLNAVAGLLLVPTLVLVVQMPSRRVRR